VRRTDAAAPTAGAPQALGLSADPSAAVSRSARDVTVRWQNSRYPMAMVRDAATGEVMGFVRRSGAAVATGGRAVEVVFSDGVRSTVVPQ